MARRWSTEKFNALLKQKMAGKHSWLAAKIGVPASTTSRYKKGSVPRGDMVGRIAGAFGVSEDELYEGTEAPRSPRLEIFSLVPKIADDRIQYLLEIVQDMAARHPRERPVDPTTPRPGEPLNDLPGSSGVGESVDARPTVPRKKKPRARHPPQS